MRRGLVMVMVCVTLLSVVSGCSSGPTLEGKWTATSARPQTLVPEFPIRLEFANGRLSGTAGCNTFGGGYSVSNGVLSAPQLAMTMMYCEGPRGEQEAWFTALLASSPTVSVDGDTLTMTGATSTVVFRRG